jgi:uncharacterized protein YjbI with pentapeptide repeats/beta-lactamase regulating signal transducer with metallopeptidase domain
MIAWHALGTFATTVTAVGLNSLWEDALVVACVWIFLRTWPRVNAATRYVIWSAALVATVVVPVATTLPFLSMSPPAAATATVKASVPSVTHAFAAAPALHAAALPPYRSVPEPLRRPHVALPFALAVVFASVWLLLAILGLVRLGAGLFRLERLKHDALPLPVDYRSAMLRWNGASKGSRDVRLCVSDDIDVPVAVGLFDSMILIPRALLEQLSAEEVDQIALHELAHLRRADDWTNGLQRIVLAAFGWNPSVRFAAAQLDLEREVACDDYVLASSDVVRPYAMCLAKMAESSSWPHRPMAAPAVFATRKHISLRIERLLFPGRATGTNPSVGIAACAVAGVAALGLAIGSIAPSVAATAQVPVPPIPAQAVIHAPAVREIVRYVNVPRSVKLVNLPRSVKFVAFATPAPVATFRPAAPVKHAATAPIATAPPAKRLAPIKPITAVAPGSHAVVSDSIGPISVHVPSIHIPGIDIDIPKLADIKIPKLTIGDVRGNTCIGCDESGVDWRGRDLRGVSYTGVDLSRANLDSADFSGAHLSGVDFTRAHLRGTSFRNARLTGCDFSSADLSGADFSGAQVSGCQFSHAQLVSARIRSIVGTCSGCDFSDSTIGGADLSNLHASGIDFSGADLSHVNLSGSSFTSVDFAGARMGGAGLDGTTFTNCDLSGTGLTRAALSRAKLIDSDIPDDR